MRAPDRTHAKKALVIVLILVVVASPVIGESLLSGFFTTQGEIHYQTDNGLEVVTTKNYNLQSGNPFTPTSMNVSTESNGWVNVSSSGSGSIQIDEINGTWTNTSSINASSTNITINPHDKQQITVGGGVESVNFRSMALDDGTADFTYQASSSGSITITGLPANTDVSIGDANGDDLSATKTTDGSGTVTFSLPAEGSEESVYLFSSEAPSFDSGSFSPTGDLSTDSVTLTANISDTDFSHTAGDDVSVEFLVKSPSNTSFSTVGSDSRTSNGSVSTSYTASEGGDYDWKIEATDAYGNTITSATQTFSTPSVVTFRSETNTSQVINTTDVKVTAYYSGEVQRRTVTDGTLDLTGFPVNEPIVIRANASNYSTRTAVIESIYEQNNVYLLNESESTHLVRFDLQDLTGNYERSETVLFVERDLELNGSVEWRTIAGDNFGVQGTPVTLAADERYRLRIKNLDTGTTTVIGSYTVIQSETVTLSTGSASLSVPDSEREYSWTITENETSQKIRFKYSDSAKQTEAIKLTIHERFNKSNVLVDNTTFTDTNDLTYQKQLTNEQVNKTWMAELYVDRGDGYAHFRLPISSGPRTLIPGGLDSVWVSGIGVFIVLISGMAFSTLNQGVGAITTSLVGGTLWWFGILDPVTAGPAVVLALAVSIVWHYRSSPGGVT